MYFDHEAILSEEHKVPVRFRSNGYRLGYLLASSAIDPQETVNRGARVSLPLWMAQPLCGQRFVHVDVDKLFTDVVKQRLTADALKVDLSKLCPHFYTLGRHLCVLDSRTSQDIGKLLIDVYVKRFTGMVMDKSSSGYNQDRMTLTKKLSMEEQSLVNSVAGSAGDLKRWRKRTIDVIEPAPLLHSSKRRAI
eukprot:ANDGO_08257.mRNA.1 DNA replication complex GINS protein psf3